MALVIGRSGRATVAAGGTATVFIPGPNRTGIKWQISQVVLNATPATSSTACTASVYRSAVQPGLRLGGSLVASADTLIGSPGDELAPGDQLVVTFAGCLVGSTVFVNMYVTEVDQ